MSHGRGYALGEASGMSVEDVLGGVGFRCPGCRERLRSRYDYEDLPETVDVVKFRCPHCGATMKWIAPGYS